MKTYRFKSKTGFKEIKAYSLPSYTTLDGYTLFSITKPAE